MPWIPLTAAMAFPFAAMALKRALEATRDFNGVLFICNLALALAFVPWLLKSYPASGISALWQPMLAGSFFFMGQIAAFKSFQGELSIAIPVQGTKVLLLAFLAMLVLGQSISARTWAASGLSVAAIHFLHDKGTGDVCPEPVWRTLAYAFCAALAFACFDVCVQKWAPQWEWRRFGAWAFLGQAILSFSLLTSRHSMRFFYGARNWAWLIAGAGGTALITVGLVFAIGNFGKATEVNLLFNSRCIWAVMAVWLLGKRFGNREARCGRRAMGQRLGGAGMMLAAIALTLY